MYVAWSLGHILSWLWFIKGNVHCVIYQNIFLHKHFLCLVHTPSDIKPMHCFLNEAPGYAMSLLLSRIIFFNLLPTSLTKEQSIPCALREQCLFKRSLFFHFYNNLHFSSTDSLRLNGFYLAIQTRSKSNAFLL